MTPGCPGTHRPLKTPTPLAALRAGLITPDDLRRFPPHDPGPTLRKMVAKLQEQAGDS